MNQNVLIAICVVIAILVVGGLVLAGMGQAHETKMKRMEVVKVCIHQDRPVEACRRLGSA